MPIFEFHCKACNHKFERLLLRRDADVQCPECQGTEVQRLISVCSFSSADGSVRAAGTSSCSSCTAATCSSCGGGSSR